MALKKGNYSKSSCFLSLVDKYVKLVELLYVSFNCSQLFFVFFFLCFQTDGINNSNMSQFLILKVYFIPFALQSLSDCINLFFRKTFPNFNLKNYFCWLYCSWRFWIILYSLEMFSLTFYKYSGTWPKSFFFK